MQCIAYFLPVTGFTVGRRVVIIFRIPCFAVGNQAAALGAGYKVFFPAGGTKVIPLVVTVPVGGNRSCYRRRFLHRHSHGKEAVHLQNTRHRGGSRHRSIRRPMFRTGGAGHLSCLRSDW